VRLGVTLTTGQRGQTKQSKEKNNMSLDPEPTEWLECGDLDPKTITDPHDLMDQCCALLDAAYAHDILGGLVVFKASDGKHYRVTVEAVVSEIDDEDYIKDLKEGLGNSSQS
jgi:hypothetical protein